MLNKIEEPKKALSKRNISIILIITLLYWVYEAQAPGNIRVDLLLFYPILFVIYLLALWQRFKYYAIVISIGLMILNIIFFINSYKLFHKNVG